MFRPVLIFLFCLSLTVQSQIGPRGWQEHISINSANSVARLGSYIYASNRAEIIYFDQKELAPRSLSKINGLSDVGIRLLRTNAYNNSLLVVYDNCNLDLITNRTTVRNYPDFKLKALNGKKIVNEVTFKDQFAYLACGFGIVVFDTEKREIRDTYIIGPNATELEVFQVSLNDSLIFAATPSGLYYSNYKTRILNNYRNWKRADNLPVGPYAGIINVKGQVITAYSPSKLSDTLKNKDTLYELNTANKWEKYAPFKTQGQTISRFSSIYESAFSFVSDANILILNAPDGKIVSNLNSFNGAVDYGQMRDMHMSKDHTGNISYWVADNRFGLYQTFGYYPYEPQRKLTRNGTNSPQIGMVDAFKGLVALAPSQIGNAGVANAIREGINILKDGEWTYLPTLDNNSQPLIDVTSVLIDRLDPTQMWVANWFNGVYLYKDNVVKAAYTPSNTTMPKYADGLPRCGGLSMDKKGNVFFAHSDQKGFLGVIHAEDGQYQNLSFDNGRFTRKTFADRNGNVWMLHERDGGITVYKPSLQSNGKFAAPVKDFNFRVLDNAPGSGNLESKSVYAIAEDLDGRIWIGTTAGIRVIYNSASLFSGGDYDAQAIKIVQDGNVELLLGKETVTSIVVDGANNKWCGTLLGGVYCFSSDGQRQLYHFTKENSPLFSNTIVDINYNAVTGDIFFGTEVGLQSFRGVVIEGSANYSDIYAYPNPVKPGYSGTVQIRGLVSNSIVKIGDESGSLVWETKSAGGQVEWPLTTLSGSRVTSGVYLVHAATTDGEFRAVAKILVIN